jgi:hypothetical protein
MYEFAVVALLGLATLKVVDLLSELVPSIAKARTLTTFVVSVAAVVALDYSVFQGFGIAVRENWLGTVMTGFVVGALAAAWQTVLGYLGTSEGTAGGSRRNDRPRIAA